MFSFAHQGNFSHCADSQHLLAGDSQKVEMVDGVGLGDITEAPAGVEGTTSGEAMP